MSTPSKKIKRLWTPKEDAILRSDYPFKRVADVSSLLGRSTHSIQQRASTLGIRKQVCFRAQPNPANRIYQVNESFFTPLTAASSYVVGFIAADGCLQSGTTSTIHLNNTEIEVLEKINAAMSSNYPIRTATPTNPNWAPQHRLIFYSHLIFKSLLEIGLTPRKSRTLQMPNISDELFFHFLRGFFDGDGCAQANNKGKSVLISFVSASENFLLALSKRCSELLGIPERPLYLSKNKTGKAWHLAFHGLTAFVVGDAMYKDANDLFLSRKRDFLESYRGTFMRRPRWMASKATEKVCSVCKETKPLESFWRQTTSPDGRGCTCIPCDKNRNKLRYL